jgi:hypothetical protein
MALECKNLGTVYIFIGEWKNRRHNGKLKCLYLYSRAIVHTYITNADWFGSVGIGVRIFCIEISHTQVESKAKYNFPLIYI